MKEKVYSNIIIVAMLFATLGFVTCDTKNTRSTGKQNEESTSKRITGTGT